MEGTKELTSTSNSSHRIVSLPNVFEGIELLQENLKTIRKLDMIAVKYKGKLIFLGH